MIISALALVVASASPGPANVRTLDAPTANASSQSKAPSTQRHNAATRYCVDSTPTGTRIKSRTCRTREEWRSYDFDPLAKD